MQPEIKMQIKMMKSHLKDAEVDNMLKLQPPDGIKINKKQIKMIEGTKFYSPNKWSLK